MLLTILNRIYATLVLHLRLFTQIHPTLLPIASSEVAGLQTVPLFEFDDVFEIGLAFLFGIIEELFAIGWIKFDEFALVEAQLFISSVLLPFPGSEKSG